ARGAEREDRDLHPSGIRGPRSAELEIDALCAPLGGETGAAREELLAQARQIALDFGVGELADGERVVEQPVAGLEDRRFDAGEVDDETLFVERLGLHRDLELP